MFGQIGIWQVLIVALVILVLFGRGRISEMMGDFGKGISSFKKGMSEDVDGKPASKAQIEAPAQEASAAEKKATDQSDSAN